MTCTKCKKEIPAESIYCLNCGKKQLVTPKPKVQKRPNGMGSVVKLSGTRAKPYAILLSSKKPDGTKCRISGGTFETSTQAKKALAELIAQGVPDLYNVTLEQAREKWKATHFENLTESGKTGYNAAWNYLLSLKDKKLRELKAEHYQEIINKMQEDGKSQSTCEKVKQQVSQLCRWGIKNDVLDKNYGEFIGIKPQEKKDKEIFSDAEIKKLRTEYDKTKSIATGSILLLCYTGLRIDEFLTLGKSDYRDGCFFGGSKTEKGRNRTIPVPDSVKDIADTLAATEGNYLYSNATGNKYDVKNWRNRVFYKTLESLGIENKTPHSCRHTFASMCVKKGVNPKALQDIIGHEDISTTMNVYTHTDMDWLKQAIKNL